MRVKQLEPSGNNLTEMVIELGFMNIHYQAWTKPALGGKSGNAPAKHLHALLCCAILHLKERNSIFQSLFSLEKSTQISSVLLLSALLALPLVKVR